MHALLFENSGTHVGHTLRGTASTKRQAALGAAVDCCWQALLAKTAPLPSCRLRQRCCRPGWRPECSIQTRARLHRCCPMLAAGVIDKYGKPEILDDLIDGWVADVHMGEPQLTAGMLAGGILAVGVWRPAQLLLCAVDALSYYPHCLPFSAGSTRPVGALSQHVHPYSCAHE